MPREPFKGALCLDSIPDAAGYEGVRSWSSGDREAVLTKEPVNA